MRLSLWQLILAAHKQWKIGQESLQKSDLLCLIALERLGICLTMCEPGNDIFVPDRYKGDKPTRDGSHRVGHCS